MPGSHLDQLVVSQDVVFDGTLDIDLLGSYMPRLGDEFILATYAERRGTFAATDLPLLSPGTYWAIDYGSTALTLTVSKTLAGDVTLDGMVTDADAALFATYLGLESGSTWATGDFNGDGMTTLADLALLQANLGMSAPSPEASTAAVPEPASWGLALMFVTATLAARRLQRGL
jgi:hypothetical protein